MPLLHRLATLRDDVIFFVYLYQSWKYKVDYTRYVFSCLLFDINFAFLTSSRVNEFGQVGPEVAAEEPAADKAAHETETEKARTVDVAIKTSGSAQKGNATKRK
jgi:hypothetical protein